MDGTRARKKIGDYTFEKELGKGEFGRVYQATSAKNGKSYAIKCLSKEQLMSNQLFQKLMKTEVNIMNKINHPNIVHLHELLETPNNYYMVMDYCNKGDFERYLFERRLRFLEENEARIFFKQIMNAFKELRKHKVIHRDFKMANLLVHDDTVKISDFGLAKRGRELAKTIVGTYMTMAPELLVSDGETEYTSKSDLWAIGFVFYQILFGEPPFFGLSPNEIFLDIKLKEGKLKFPRPISAECKDLLKRLLRSNPDERIEWDQFFDHPLFLTNSSPSLNSLKSASMSTEALSGDVISVARRYFHEKHKILFIVYTVRNIRKMQKKLQDSPYNNDMYLTCIFLMKKAILLNELNLLSLTNSNNVFEMNSFEDFVKSNICSQVVTNFSEDNSNFTVYYNHLLQTKPADLILPSSLENPTLEQLDEEIKTKLGSLVKLVRPENGPERRNILLMLVSISSSIFCEKQFLYDSHEEVFEWVSFYALHEKMPESKLIEILSLY